VTKATILELFDFYRDAPEEERAEIGRASAHASLPNGAVFYREGESCPHFALVGTGDIRVFRSHSNGREITLYHVRDGQPCLVNMLCVFLGRAAMASAIVEAPTEAVVVPAPLYRKWITTSEGLRAFVFQTMAARMVEVMTLVEEVTIRKMDARLAALLLRAFHIRKEEPVIVTTHDELAAEIGTAREVVSRVLKDFERSGAVHLGRDRITLANEHALRRIAGDAPLV